MLRFQVQAINYLVFDRFWVISQDAEVVNGIAVHRITVDLLVVVEHTVTPKWPSTNYMSVRHDVSGNL